MCNSSAPGSSVLGPVLQGELARRTRNRVVAVEAGAAEAVLPLLCGGDHRVDGEIGQGGSPDVGPDLLHRQVRAYELIRTIHVDAIIAGAFDRGRRDPEVDLSSAGLEEQLDQLAARVAAYDGVVHDDHPFAFDHAGQRVELEPDAELAHTVGRLDESTANVAVLYKAFRVRDAAPLRVAYRRHHPRVGNGDDNISLGRRLIGQELTHPVPGAGDLASVEARVGTGEVHVLEDAQGTTRGLGPVARQAIVVYDDDFAGLHVAQELGADDVKAARLAGDGVTALDLTDREGTEAVRVAESDELVTEDHGHRVSAFEAAHRLPDRLPDREPPLQLPHGRGRDVRRVRGRVESEAVLSQAIPQLPGVHEVAVVGDGHVHVTATTELGLSILPRGGAGRRVADVAKSEVSGLKSRQARSIEDLRDEAHVAHRGRALAIRDGDAGRFLAPVLESVEPEVRALCQLSRELAVVEPEDSARFLRLAFRIPVVHVEGTHLPALRSCPTRSPSSRARTSPQPSLRYPMCPPSGACASKRSRSYAALRSDSFASIRSPILTLSPPT